MLPVRATRGCRRTLGAAAALALVACVASCGSDSSSGLSQERASTLRSSLTRIEQRVSSSDCTGATEQVGEFRRQIDALPSRVDAGLREALDGSAARLEKLVADQCKPATAAPAETPTQEPPATDQNSTDQQGQGKKDKKSKKEKKPKDVQPPPDTGGTTGQDGATGVTGPEGTTLPPGGG